MKKNIILLAVILFCNVEAKRAYGIVSVGTGWTNFYQTVFSDWFARRADFLVQTKSPYTEPRQAVVDAKTYNFYHIPVGILQSPAIKVYIAPGTLVDLELLIDELEELEKLGIDTKKRIRISASAQILMPYEKKIGEFSRKKKNSKVTGSVRVGVGVAGADKCMGVAFRMADLMSSDYKILVKESVDRGNETLTKLYHEKPIDLKEVTSLFNRLRKILKPYVRDGIELKFNQMLSHGKVGLFDSPYGTYLDSTHGTYCCTSGVSALASSICASAGVGIKRIKTVVGVVDSYSIYPGSGKIITEIHDEKVIQKVKDNFGKRYKKEYQYGWIDLVMIRQSVMINGIDCLAFNGLHLLDDLDEIKMCIDYDLDGRHLDFPPPAIEDQKRVVPHYIVFPGWKTSTKNARTFTDLPQEARIFIKQLESLAGVPIAIISVGQEPHEMVLVQEYFFP